jgi:hypothetical protein
MDEAAAEIERLTTALNEETECARQTDDVLAKTEAEIERLRAGIQAFLDGDWEPKVKKMDKCPHGQYGYESCEACIEIWFEHLLDARAAPKPMTREPWTSATYDKEMIRRWEAHEGLRAEIELLRAALKPFAKVASEWDDEDISLEVELRAYDDRPGPGINVADFRKARAALETKT